jgi:hypothetical protein
MFAVLGVFLPVAFVIGIAARRAVPQATTLPPELSARSQTFTATGFDRDDLIAKSPVRVRLWREQNTGRLAVGFAATENFIKPDLLVYWVAGKPTVTDGLPANATMLGAFVAGPLVLPTEAASTEGSLILFSLANQEIVEVSKPFTARIELK